MARTTNILQLLTYAALSSSATVIPLFAAQNLGADLQWIGLIGAAYGVAAGFSEVVFGRLGDRVDRRRLLMVGFLAAGVAYGLQAFSTSPASLLVARFLVGFAAGMIPATLAAYVYEIRRPLGNFTSYNALGWLAGAILVIAVGAVAARPSWSAWVSEKNQYQLLFILSAFFCAIAWFVSWRLRPMRIRIEAPRLPTQVLAKNLHVYLPIFLRHVGATAVWVSFPLFVFSIGGDLALIGWLYVINMVTQVVLLRNADRFALLGSPRVLIPAGLALSAIAFATFTLASRAVQLLPLQMLVGVGFACLFLGSLKEVLEANVERATATGLLNATLSLSNVVGPIIGGLVAAAYGFHAAMYMGAGITLAGLAVFVFSAARRPARKVEGPQAAAGPVGEVGP